MPEGNQFVDILKWLMEGDFRWKNALSLLVALVAMAVFYFVERHSVWFDEVEAKGNYAIGVAIVVATVIWFLVAWLVISAAEAVTAPHRAAREKLLRDYENLKRLEETLDTASKWQRSFLIRFVVEKVTQIKEWEVGGYKAIWGPEMEVLCAKGIIRQYPGGVIEIAPEYLDFLLALWDPATQKLGSVEDI